MVRRVNAIDRRPVFRTPPSWIVLGLYLVLSAAYTFPLFSLGSQRLYGFQVDIARSIHLYWCAGQSGDVLFLDQVWPQLNAPFGWKVPATPQYLYYWTAVFLSKLCTRCWTNAYIAVSFPLAAWFFYLLAFRLTRSSAGSFLGGFLFSFSPWHFSKSHGYPDMAGIQWMPLYALLVVHFWEKPCMRRGFIAGLGFLWLFNYSFVLGYMAGLFTLVIAAGWIGWKRWKGRPWSAMPLAGLCAFVVTHLAALGGWLFYRVASIPYHPIGIEVFARGMSWKDFNQGTVPWTYFFIPAYYHPLWHQSMYDWMLRMRPDTWFLEDIVNPGYVVWVLAVAGWIRMARAGRTMPQRKLWLTVTGLGFLAAWLCIDPRWGGILLPFPNVLCYALFPVFRFYARFGLLVSLFLTLVAVWGFAKILECKPTWWKRTAFAAAMVMAGFELYCPVPRLVTDISGTPNAYRWLKEAPRGIVAEYPMFASHLKWEVSYLFWQTVHAHPLYNADYQGVGNLKLRRMTVDFRKERTMRILCAIGVRYMLVHKNLYAKDGIRLGVLPEKLYGATKAAEWPESAVYEIPRPVRHQKVGL